MRYDLLNLCLLSESSFKTSIKKFLFTYMTKIVVEKSDDLDTSLLRTEIVSYLD